MNVDVVVVGAGSAGTTLAARLSEDPGRSVLLLEAGLGAPLPSDDDLLSNVSFATTRRDWSLRAKISGERVLDYPQGKFVGGGSAVNGALAFRGAPRTSTDGRLRAIRRGAGIRCSVPSAGSNAISTSGRRPTRTGRAGRFRSCAFDSTN